MIFERLFDQVRRQRVRNGLGVRDNKFSETYRAFLALHRKVARGESGLPDALRHEIKELHAHQGRAVCFRLMTRIETKRAGLKAPRVLVEPSPELKKVIAQVDEYLAKPQAEKIKENDERSCRVRAAMGLASSGN